MDRASWGERIWYDTSVPVFLERYLLPLAAALTVLIIVTNPMALDWTQRITGGLAVVFIAYFVAHTVHRSNSLSASLVPAKLEPLKEEAKPSGYASADGRIFLPPD